MSARIHDEMCQDTTCPQYSAGSNLNCKLASLPPVHPFRRGPSRCSHYEYVKTGKIRNHARYKDPYRDA